MGRKLTSRNKQHPASESELELSDIDQFYQDRERIALEDDTQRDGSDFEDDSAEEVFGLNDSDSEEDDGSELDSEQEREVLARVPGLRKHLKKRGEDMESLSEGGSDEEEDMAAWGNRKSAFYNDDAEFDDEAIDDEVEEAGKLQERRLQTMDERDFMGDDFSSSDGDEGEDDSLGARVKSGKSSKPVALSSSQKENEQIVREMDDELEKIDLMEDQVHNQDQEIDEENKEAILARLSSESPELLGLVNDFKDKLGMVDNQVSSLISRIKDGELSANGGISLLDVKNQLMINYLLNLCFYFFLKADSAKNKNSRVKDHPVIEKLVKLRLYLEKLKPIEQKLKPQIDRLIKSSLSSANGSRGTSSGDAYNYKADPSALAVDDAAGGSGDEDGDSHAVYRPPKIAPMQYTSDPEDGGEEDGSTRRNRLNKKSERIIREALQEFEDAPEEIIDAGNVYANTDAYEDREWLERARAEEEMMTRLPSLKKDKKRQKGRLVDELDGLDDFGDFSYFENAGSNNKSLINEKFKIASTKQAASDQEESDDDYYNEMKSQKHQQKKAKLDDRHNQQQNQKLYYSSEEEGKGKRNVNYEIMANKGIMPTRTKEQRNPRVKRRVKFEKSMIKLKSVKPVVNANAQQKAYAGEQTGIKRNLARSVKF